MSRWSYKRIIKEFSNAEDYDRWYEQNGEIYRSELEFTSKLLGGSRFIEIGAGTGRFGGTLGAFLLIDVSREMLEIAAAKGFECVLADAASLPLRSKSTDAVLFAFSLSFMPYARALREALRVSREKIIIVDVDPASEDYVKLLKDFYTSYEPARILRALRQLSKRYNVRLRRAILTSGTQEIGIIGILVPLQQKCERKQKT
ncbi:MAG: class I SAM-dependent methyltransferase [Nitrososphaeria archaeon]